MVAMLREALGPVTRAARRSARGPEVVRLRHVQHLVTAVVGQAARRRRRAHARGAAASHAGGGRHAARAGARAHRRGGAARARLVRRAAGLDRPSRRRRVRGGAALGRRRRATRPRSSPAAASWPTPTPSGSGTNRRPSCWPSAPRWDASSRERGLPHPGRRRCGRSSRAGARRRARRRHLPGLALDAAGAGAARLRRCCAAGSTSTSEPEPSSRSARPRRAAGRRPSWPPRARPWSTSRPAVAEARYGRVPLILLTADRPPELQGRGRAADDRPGRAVRPPRQVVRRAARARRLPTRPRPSCATSVGRALAVAVARTGRPGPPEPALPGAAAARRAAADRRRRGGGRVRGTWSLLPLAPDDDRAAAAAGAWRRPGAR